MKDQLFEASRQALKGPDISTSLVSSQGENTSMTADVSHLAPIGPSVLSTSSHGTGLSSQGSFTENDNTNKPKRKKISPEQLETLVALFSRVETPTYELRKNVGAQLKMSNREVQVRLMYGYLSVA